MPLNDLKSGTACVLGAGEGLGAAFSRDLASRGFDLLLVDKNPVSLEALGNEIRHQYNIAVTLEILDLNSTDAIDRLQSVFADKDVRFVVYNAAYGPVRPFLDNTPEQLDQYIEVNMRTTLHLVHAFTGLNKTRKAGILFLSSLAGFHGSRYVVPYAATKAFCWNLAEGLHYEFSDTNMGFSVCVAGAVDTPNYKATNPAASWLTPKPMSPEKVACEALDKFGKRMFIIPGKTTKLVFFIMNRLLPRKLASGLQNKAMQTMYG
jgi:hypothetical protein